MEAAGGMNGKASAAADKVAAEVAADQWRRLTDYPGYKFGRDGEVRGLIGENGRPLQGRTRQTGRRLVAMVVKGKLMELDRATLIMKAHGPPAPAGSSGQVVHLDGDLSNCRVENLAWEGTEAAARQVPPVPVSGTVSIEGGAVRLVGTDLSVVDLAEALKVSAEDLVRKIPGQVGSRLIQTQYGPRHLGVVSWDTVAALRKTGLRKTAPAAPAAQPPPPQLPAPAAPLPPAPPAAAREDAPPDVRVGALPLFKAGAASAAAAEARIGALAETVTALSARLVAAEARIAAAEARAAATEAVVAAAEARNKALRREHEDKMHGKAG